MDAEIVERFAIVDGRLIRLEAATDGLRTWVTEESAPFHKRMNTFVDQFQATELERDKVQARRHAENQEANEKLNSRVALWGTIIALLGLVCTVCMLYLAANSARHAENDPAHIFHDNHQSQMYAENNQELTTRW